jgi:hypothetical protein
MTKAKLKLIRDEQAQGKLVAMCGAYCYLVKLFEEDDLLQRLGEAMWAGIGHCTGAGGKHDRERGEAKDRERQDPDRRW